MKSIVKSGCAVFVVALVVSSCSTPGPVVRVPPTVSVAKFNSVLFTPEAISFEANVVINNELRAELTVDKVDWVPDLHDNPVAEEAFTQVSPTRAKRLHTLTVPFKISMKQLADQAVDVLAEESIRVGFNGTVHPSGFESVPFSASKTIPMPTIPVVTIARTGGNPLDGASKVLLEV